MSDSHRSSLWVSSRYQIGLFCICFGKYFVIHWWKPDGDKSLRISSDVFFARYEALYKILKNDA